MYKRQDWLHLHGQNAAEASSSDSEAEKTGDDESEAQSSEEESSDNESSGQEAAVEQEEEPEDNLPAHRLEDLSEDDFDGGAASDDSDVAKMQEKLAEQKRNWLTATKEDVKKGPPLTCLLCKGVLILNAEGLRMHLASRRHKKQQSRLEDAKEDTIVYAEDLQEDSSDAETHQERAERVARLAEKQKDSTQAKVGRKRQRYNAAQGKKRKGKKLGKRQRLSNGDKADVKGS
ncbi:g13049 [Coccomyxa viridis]|uniref:G13049 protein n=1 Tax=Coccomyxa viridis TaxID=1274662 RepID=A0ABP1GBU8_9CHLO